ncbi:MAG: hypothetical protein FWF29_02435, partial [Treponema sp.]|nr:hypothetical protein [Treponema sp.]
MRNSKSIQASGIIKFCSMIAVLCSLLMIACALPHNPVIHNKPDTGMGTVKLTIDGTNARTLYPSALNALSYSVTCTATGETSVNATLAGGTGFINLKADVEWTITVVGKNDSGNIGTAAITVTLTEGQEDDIVVYLTPITGAGTLDYSVLFPSDQVASALLYYDGSDDPIDLTTDGSGSLTLATGSYLVNAVLLSTDSSRQAGNTETVHIYPGLTTVLDWTFTADDFSTTMDIPVNVTIAHSGTVTVTGVTLVSSDENFAPCDGAEVTGQANVWAFTVKDVPLVDTSIKGLQLVIETSNNSVTTAAKDYTIPVSNLITLDAVNIYALALNAGANGSLAIAVTGSSYSQIATDAAQADLLGGETVTVTATPDDGYTVSAVTAGSNITLAPVAGQDGVYTFTMPAADASVSAEFIQNGAVQITVKVDADFSGLPPSFTLSKSSADPLIIDLTARADFDSVDWYIDGASVSTGAAEYSIDPSGLAVGPHKLSIVVAIGSMQYSKTINFTVTVTPPDITVITITGQPAESTELTEGAISGSLSVTAWVDPAGAPSYQWYQSASPDMADKQPVGANSPDFAIPTDLTAGDYYFQCTVSADKAQDAASQIAKVTVDPAVIIPDPGPVELTAGDSDSVAADATSGTVTFTGAGDTVVSASDFLVDNNATVTDAANTAGTVTVTIAFAANTDTNPITYTVSINPASPTIQGAATVAVVQAAAATGGTTEADNFANREVLTFIDNYGTAQLVTTEALHLESGKTYEIELQYAGNKPIWWPFPMYFGGSPVAYADLTEAAISNLEIISDSSVNCKNGASGADTQGDSSFTISCNDDITITNLDGTPPNAGGQGDDLPNGSFITTDDTTQWYWYTTILRFTVTDTTALYFGIDGKDIWGGNFCINYIGLRQVTAGEANGADLFPGLGTYQINDGSGEDVPVTDA